MTDRSGKRKNYFDREILVMKFCGISLTEEKSVAYNIYSFIVRYFFITSYPFVAFSDLNKHGFHVFVQSFALFLSAILASSGSIALYRNRIKFGKLLKKLQKAPFVANPERGGDKEEKLIGDWILVTKTHVLPLYIATVWCLIFMYSYTLFKRLSSNDPQDWIFVLGPITLLDITRSPNFEISLIYQHITTCYVGITVCCIIITLSEILAFMCVQFQMLQNNLRTLTSNYRRESIKDPNTIEPSEISWTYLEKAVKDVVSYHLNILEVVSEVDATFSIFMLLLFTTMLLILSLAMYAALSVESRDSRILLFLTEILIAFSIPGAICYWGEQVAYESEQVARAAYEVNFVGSDLRFQKCLNLIIVRSQSAARIKAGHLVETSMETFAWIVRSSFSYLMIVRKLTTNE